MDKTKNINLKSTKKDKTKNKKSVNNNSTKNDSKLKQNLKINDYLKEIKKTSYKSVSMKLHAKLRKKDLTNLQKKEIKEDIEMLQKWRKNNPNKKNNNKNLTNKKLLNKQVIEYNNTKKNKLFESSIKEFQDNLNNDFNNNTKIKQLTTKEILNLIKDE